MNRAEQTLRLLASFYYILGTMVCLNSSVGLCGVLLFLPAIGLICSSYSSFFNVWSFLFGLFLIVLLAGLAFGLSLIFPGRNLNQRRHFRFCHIVAAITCLFVPFGTVLGVVTLIVLNPPEMHALFNPPSSPSPIA